MGVGTLGSRTFFADTQWVLLRHLDKAMRIYGTLPYPHSRKLHVQSLELGTQPGPMMLLSNIKETPWYPS